MASMDVLPDSRLTDKNFGAVMMDWPLPSGRTMRVECVPVFCANCGLPYGYVPRDNTAFAFWLCQQCFETHGAVAGTFAQPDAEFCAAVAVEMENRFGRSLTAEEIVVAQDRGLLGRELGLLIKESPYAVFNQR